MKVEGWVVVSGNDYQFYKKLPQTITSAFTANVYRAVLTYGIKIRHRKPKKPRKGTKRNER